MDAQQEQPLFEMDGFINSFRKMFPNISDEYWSLILGMSHIRGRMDWNEYGKLLVNEQWAGPNERKELVEKYVGTIIKQYL